MAKVVDRGNVGAVEEVERVGDEVDLEALAEGDAPGKAHIHLEKVRRCEGVPAEISDAARGRSYEGHLKRRAVAVETHAGRTEGRARNKGRRGAAANRGASRRGAEVETRAVTGKDARRHSGCVVDDGGS